MTKQQKSFDEWHIVVRCREPKGSDVEYEKGLKGRVLLYCEELTEHKNVKQVLVGEEVGRKEGKLHWHLSVKLHKLWTDATMRKRLKKHFVNDTFSLQKCKKKWNDMCRYTVKTAVFFSYGFEEGEPQKLHQSWKPDKEYKDENKKSGKTIVSIIYDELLEKKIDTENIEYVAQYVVDWYANKKKSANDFQLKAVIRGVMIQSKDYRDQYAADLVTALCSGVR